MLTIEQRALCTLILGAIAIGMAPIFVRLADVGYTAAAFWRLCLAVPPLWLMARFEPRTAGGNPTGLWLMAGVFFALDLGVWHQSIRYTSVANATLLANLAPIFVALGAYFCFGERVNRGFVAGLVLALGGAGMLAYDSLGISPAQLHGDGLGVLTAVFYAGYILSVSRARRRGGVFRLMLWTTVISALALLPVALLVDAQAFWPRSASGWAVLAGLALLSHAAGQGLIAWSLAHLPAAFGSVSLLVQPLAAAVFAWLLLHESFTLLQAGGGMVVIVGIFLCRRHTSAPAQSVDSRLNKRKLP